MTMCITVSRDMVGDSPKTSIHCDSCMDNEKLLAHIRDTMRQEMAILSDQFQVLFNEFEEQKQLLRQIVGRESSSSLGDGDESPFRTAVRPPRRKPKQPKYQ
ncbi:uncharacterized protein LOC133839882 [Drosophila sulfurigaster albostrigata]|uniref:Uncharacterized protein LOC117563789 isoform X1 n=2 Tax=Drosophila albomicans TaxID=7291 RepID=A0A6P8W3Y7_DROAB|nr:uncharacterized protein LOC117563789 isoform X1 [Drosophila albomicans]XP_060666213.1 uncharacterized protein LOC132798385 isoform X1 [Drosophila nasuta]XP_062127538.1 uncharacterized protein LOC133839882 [Drosophila sulfurigaster albostrigata]